MPDGGKLTIETANAYLDERYAREHRRSPPGQYVMIARLRHRHRHVAGGASRAPSSPSSPPRRWARAPASASSMVYGFVKQSGGHVKIYSEPGEGTTVKIYLPRLLRADADARRDASRSGRRRARADGTARRSCVVEDDERVRDAHRRGAARARLPRARGARRRRRRCACSTRTAGGRPAVHRRGAAGGERAPAGRRGARRWPGLKVLFTTGYTRNAIVHHGVLDPGVQLITKPFTMTSWPPSCARCWRGRRKKRRRAAEGAADGPRAATQLAPTMGAAVIRPPRRRRRRSRRARSPAPARPCGATRSTAQPSSPPGEPREDADLHLVLQRRVVGEGEQADEQAHGEADAAEQRHAAGAAASSRPSAGRPGRSGWPARRCRRRRPACRGTGRARRPA